MKCLTEQQVEKAIYLDFEGPGSSQSNPEPDPILIGMLCEDKYEVVVHGKGFESWANEKEFEFLPLRQLAERVYQRANSEKRHIVHWSSHEPSVFSRYGISLDGIGFDLKKPAKKIFRQRFRHFKKDQKDFRLSSTAPSKKKQLRPQAFSLLTLIAQDELGLPRPASFGAGYVGKWIRGMLTQAVGKEDYQAWSKSVKAYATKLINHNKHDCHATQHVAQCISRLNRQEMKN
jgi:hypothetical protein